MKHPFARLLGVFMATGFVAIHAETLEQYVATCKQELGFTTTQIPALNCNNGHLFDGNGDTGDRNRINDFFGYARLNEDVDLAFACRWLENRWPATGKFLTAVSLELLIHNKLNGKTCFFAAKTGPVKDPNGNTIPGPPEGLTSTAIVSPAAANASSYWMQPADLDSKVFNPGSVSEPNQRLRCVGCHVAGPFIASGNIAPFLARHGLLNNGHDTSPHPDITKRRYRAVGSTFSGWNDIVTMFNTPDGQTCALGCHSIGYGSDVSSIDGGGGQLLIPSLQRTLSIMTNPLPPAIAVMPPTSADSHFRWVNMDSPNNDGGEYETLIGVKQRYPQFSCSDPRYMETHVVGRTDMYRGLSMKFRFNLHDGLRCLNADQGSGRSCPDFQTRYMCNGSWTPWYNTDSPSNGGDYEDRSRISGLCASPTAVQMRYDENGSFMVFNGPPDRLAQFDNKGLMCRNADQPSGRCSNYVARFSCEGLASVPAPTPLARNQNSGSIGTAEKTYIVTTTINGWQASNTTGRQIYINGVPVNPGQTPLPPRTMDGKYFFTFTSGGLSYASWSFW